MNALKMLELCLTVSVIIFYMVMGDLTYKCVFCQREGDDAHHRLQVPPDR